MTISENFPNLLNPGQIGKVKIKNRIVMAPMGNSFWSRTGEINQRVFDYYTARAKGGTGLIIMSFAHIDYPPGYRVLADLESEQMVAGHQRLVESVHSYGAKIALQLQHSGRDRADKNLDVVSASSIPWVGLDGVAFPAPRALEKDEIREIIKRCGIIAGYARQAGYDMLEIHCAHGFLFNSFMSPYLNTRKDEYGSSFENRMRFPTEIIRHIKEVAGDDYPVGVRISADEFVEGGITTEESPIMAHMLEEAGASFIDVSVGLDETKHKRTDIMRLPEGWKDYVWEAVKKAVKIPTFAGGGLKTPGVCEKIIAGGKADFIFLGSQLLADPEWPNKIYEGRLEDIRKCISCIECMGFRTGRATETHCAINITLGKERELGEIKPAEVKRKVMIAGAGPGGLEAARIAAIRGHEVTLYDKGSEVGGNLLIAAVPPGKGKLLWFRDYEASQLSKLGVAIKLGVEVTPELIDKTKPDVVIMATGSVPSVPGIPGIDNSIAVTAQDILAGKRKITGQKVVVAGGGIVGAETAELLVEQGNTVTIVEILSRIADNMELLNRRGLIDALQEKKVALLTEHEINEVTDKGLLVTDKTKGERKLVEADWVILALGSRSADNLAEVLKERVTQSHIIGDCKQPRTILAAVHEGAEAALQIH
ncbi:FAD-dependent oxidoreductase [Chloroflexota bacterium]